MSLEARKALATLLETTAGIQMNATGHETTSGVYQAGLMDGIVQALKVLEDNGYMITVIHFDHQGNDDLVCVIGDAPDGAALVSELLWTDPRS